MLYRTSLALLAFLTFSSQTHSFIVGIFDATNEEMFTRCKTFYIQHKQKDLFIPNDAPIHKNDFLTYKINHDTQEYASVFAAVFDKRNQIQALCVITPSTFNAEGTPKAFHVQPVDFIKRVKSKEKRIKMIRSMLVQYAKSNHLKNHAFYLQFNDQTEADRALFQGKGIRLMTENDMSALDYLLTLQNVKDYPMVLFERPKPNDKKIRYDQRFDAFFEAAT